MWQRIIDQLGDLVIFALVSLTFGVVKVLTATDPVGWKQTVVTVFIATAVGTLAGALALQYALGDYTSLTVSSIASLLSRDIVVAILKNREILGNLVKRAAYNIVDKITK